MLEAGHVDKLLSARTASSAGVLSRLSLYGPKGTTAWLSYYPMELRASYFPLALLAVSASSPSS